MAKLVIATRGPKTGTCNICGVQGELTEDHTPPKGCIKIGQVELQHVVNLLNVDKPAGKGRRSQNGVKYRTLCATCNNKFLGGQYDPAFIQFVNQIATILRSPMALPPVLSVPAEPQKIMRALLGHLSAQGVDRYKKGAVTESLRDYFLDPTLPLPGEIKIYYWPYPYNSHVMARDCAFIDLTIHDPCVIWFVKFFPVAFLVTFDEPVGLKIRANELSIWRNEAINFSNNERIDLRTMPHQHWPEAPTDKSVIVFGQEAVVSYPVERKKR